MRGRHALLLVLCLIVSGMTPAAAGGVPEFPPVYVVDYELVGDGKITASPPSHYPEGGTEFTQDVRAYYPMTEPGQELTLSLTATAGTNASFVRWELGRAGTDLDQVTESSTTLHLDPTEGSPSYWVVRAVFGDPVDTYDLTMEVEPAGWGTATDETNAGPYEEGSEVGIKAEAAEGYQFVNWEAPAGTFDDVSDPETTFTMPAQNVTVTANFETVEPDTYTLTMAASPAGGGTATDETDAGPYAAGTVVNIKAEAAEGYQFVNWTAPAGELGDAGAAETRFTMPAQDVTVTARFQSDEPVDCWEDDVESGKGGWTATGLWHITDRKSHSPEHSWWFGDPHTGTYGPGEYVGVATLAVRRGPLAPLATGRVQGTLTSEEIVVNGGSMVVLSFWHYRHVEYYPHGDYDCTWVEVGFNGQWQEVWRQTSRHPSQESWERVEIHLTVPSGVSSMRVRFEFDSIDGLYNDFPGWFIDDISVCTHETEALRIKTSCEDFPRGLVREPYEVQLAATGGQPPYAWSWTGEVPPGLELDQRTGQITGTPTATGRFESVFTVTDQIGGTDTLTCTLTVDDPAPVIFFEDFTDPVGWTMSGLWHVRGAHECFDCALIEGPFAYYARPGRCDFNTAVRTQGALESPPIDVSGADHLMLSFDFFRHVEYYTQDYVDRTHVYVSLDGHWHRVWARSSVDSSPECGTAEVLFETGGAHTLRIYFLFDSVDRFYNDFPGWALDNVKVIMAQSAQPLVSLAALPDAVPRDEFMVLNAPNPVTDGTTTFTVRGLVGLDVEGIHVEVYDLSGRTVWQKEDTGRQVVWQTQDMAGRPVASGVYLYEVRILVGDQWVTSGVQKLLIIR